MPIDVTIVRRPQTLLGMLSMKDSELEYAARLQLVELESREVPAVFTGQAFTTALSAEEGGTSIVRLIDTQYGGEAELQAYDSGFRGGVRVALGDVNGDGIVDIVTAPGAGGGPDVRVFDGKTGTLLRSEYVFDPSFSGGVEVAVADINRDGFADIIVGAGPGGGPNIRVVDGSKPGRFFQDFMAFDANFSGGVTVAAADLDRDGLADIIAGAGPGGGPNVRAWSSSSGKMIADFYAYNPAFDGGVFVAAVDRKGDGNTEIVTGARHGGGPHVKVFSPDGLQQKSEFFAAPATLTTGVRVAAADLNRDGNEEILAHTQQGLVRELLGVGDSLPDKAQRLSRWVGDLPVPADTQFSDFILPSSPIADQYRILDGAVAAVNATNQTITIQLATGNRVELKWRTASESLFTPASEVLLNGQPEEFANLTPGIWIRAQVSTPGNVIRRLWAWGTLRESVAA